MRHLLLPKANKMLAFTCFCLYVYIMTAGTGPDPFDPPRLSPLLSLCTRYCRGASCGNVLLHPPPARSPTLLLCNVLAL